MHTQAQTIKTLTKCQNLLLMAEVNDASLRGNEISLEPVLHCTKIVLFIIKKRFENRFKKRT